MNMQTKVLVLAHEWTIQAYRKGAGLPCNIDGACTDFVAGLARMQALNVQMLEALKKAQDQAIKYPWASGSFLNIIEEAIATAQE